MTGEISLEHGVSEQVDELRQLKRLLELDGYECANNVDIGSIKVPLVVERARKRVAVGVQPGLIDPETGDHSLGQLENRTDVSAKALNSYILKRNLPDLHQTIRALL